MHVFHIRLKERILERRAGQAKRALLSQKLDILGRDLGWEWSNKRRKEGAEIGFFGCAKELVVAAKESHLVEECRQEATRVLVRDISIPRLLV